MTEPARYRLGEFIRFKRGYDLPHLLREPGEFPIVSSSGITGTHKEPMVEGPGVVTGRYGTLGEVFYISGAYWPLNTSLYVQDFKGNDPRFVAYYLRTVLSANFNSAGAVPGVNRNVLHKITVPKPPESKVSQQKIAAVLTAYDDLIETNKRRIALLEKMAEELYREWFVRMRFPGYQNTRFVKNVPEGWRLQSFTSLVQINPRESIHKSDQLPFVGMDDLSQNSMHFLFDEMRFGSSGSKFRNRDTLFPRITPCLENGKRGFVNCLEPDQIGVGSTEFIVFREKVLPAEYIYLLSCNASFRQHAELSMTGASGRQRVKNECFEYFLIPRPPEEILRHFVNIVRPLFDSVAQMANQISILAKTRDLLLPRLISGKLSVENLDIQFPPNMREDASTPTQNIER